MKLPPFLRRRRARVSGPSKDQVRRGFTMVEMLTVAVVTGTLARVAVPDFHRVILKAQAESVAGEFETVRLAIDNYYAEHTKWPEDSYPGQVPDGLAPYLPDNFTFVRQGYRLDWENWPLPSGLPGHPDRGRLLGISIVTDDAQLGHALVDILGGGMAHYTVGSRYTFIIERD